LNPDKTNWLAGLLCLGLFGAALVTLVTDPVIQTLDEAVAEVSADFPKVPRIRGAELARWLGDSNRPPPLLLDVRTADEFAVSHLPGARQIDPNLGPRGLLASLDTNRTLVLYCTVGFRSGLAADGLRIRGVTNLFNLEGSIFRWANEGRPLVNDAGPTKLVHPYDRLTGLLLKAEHRAPLPRKPGWLNSGVPVMEQVRISAAVALLALFLAWESVAPFYQWFRGKVAARGRHAGRNLLLGALNSVMISAVFVHLWWQVANWAEVRDFGLLSALQLAGPGHTLAALLLLDLWTYGWHRLNHGIPLLWRFHRMHHSETHLDVTSASRFHLGEIAASSLLRIPILLFLGIHFGELALYETLMFAIVQFHHSNVVVPPALDRVLRQFIVTPDMHRVHHSRERRETDSNYSSLLSVWDRLFGTWVWRPDPENIALGLAGLDAPTDQTVAGMLRTPVARPGAGDR
jgi:sterol desaturase/sphingolipid hydroxylase (fatty acid hydroxylase superfamily)/rhodanese-related sulfurtransferase